MMSWEPNKTFLGYRVLPGDVVRKKGPLDASIM